MFASGTYVGAEVVEEELAASGATDVYSASEGKGLALVDFAILEVRKFLFKVANVVGDFELGMLLVAVVAVCITVGKPCKGRPCPARGAR